MNSYSSAMEFRDQIASIVREEIGKQAPQPTYAVVHTIDVPGSFCLVVYPGESSPVKANFGALAPANVGDTVRLEGPPGNRYIADVLGPTELHTRPQVLSGIGNPSGPANIGTIYVDISNSNRVRLWRYNGSVWSLVNSADPTPPSIPLATASCRRSGTISIPNGNWTPVPMTFTDWDLSESSLSMTDGTGIVIREPGYYSIEGFAPWATNSSGTRLMTLTHGGSNFVWSNTTPSGSSAANHAVRSIWCNSGVLIRMSVWQNSGNNLPLDNGHFGGTTWPRITANLIRRT